MPPVTRTRLRSLGYEVYAELDGGRAVTGEPVFAFLWQNRPGAGVLLRLSAVASWHMYIIDNTLSRTLAPPATPFPPDQACLRHNDCLA